MSLFVAFILLGGLLLFVNKWYKPACPREYTIDGVRTGYNCKREKCDFGCPERIRLEKKSKKT